MREQFGFLQASPVRESHGMNETPAGVLPFRTEKISSQCCTLDVTKIRTKKYGF